MGETRLLFVAPFGLQRKATTAYRTLPLARALAAKGHRITCLVPSWDSRSDSGRRYEDGGVEVVHLWAPPGPAALALTVDCLQSMLRAGAAGADAVHVFKPLGPPAAVALALQARRVLGGRGRLVLDTDDWEEGWGRRSGSALAGTVLRPLERWLLRSSDAVTVASRALLEMAVALRGEARSVWHLPNGAPPVHAPDAVERRSALRQRLGLADAPLLLLYTRYIECRPPRLVEVLSAVLRRSSSARLLVVGSGFGREQADLRRGLAEQGLADRVLFAGWVAPPEVETYLAAADVALYPCDDDLVVRAKCSVKLAQLLALGLPVVAEAVGECCTYLAHEETGLLVGPGAVAELAEAVACLLASPEKRERLGRAAREQMAAEFSWDTLAVGAEAAYAAIE